MKTETYMKRYHGQLCEVCAELGNENTYGTVGHHILSKGTSKVLQMRKENIIVLCNVHHNTSNTVAAHSTNPSAVKRFNDFLVHKLGKHYKEDLRALERKIIAGEEDRVS